jgi:hypothetical protein
MRNIDDEYQKVEDLDDDNAIVPFNEESVPQSEPLEYDQYDQELLWDII